MSLTGMIQKGRSRRVDTADTVCVQEYHVYSNIDGLRVLPADFLSPRRHHFVHAWSVRWQTIRFEPQLSEAQKNLSVTIMSDRLVNS